MVERGARRPPPACAASASASPCRVPSAARDGLVRFAPNLGWVDEPFTELLAAAARPAACSPATTPTSACSPSTCAAPPSGVSDVAYLSGSVGIGGGFLVGGVPLSGAQRVRRRGRAPAGRRQRRRQCRCGNVGCWETKVGENQLLDAAGRLPGGGPEGVAEVIAAAAAGDERAERALDEVGALDRRRPARASINIFNPEVIVLGGSLAAGVGGPQADVRSTPPRPHPLMSPHGEVIIRAAALGLDSPLAGRGRDGLRAAARRPAGRARQRGRRARLTSVRASPQAAGAGTPRPVPGRPGSPG